MCAIFEAKKNCGFAEKKFRPYIDMMGTSKKPVPESWPLGPFRDVSQDTTVLEDPTQTLSAYKLGSRQDTEISMPWGVVSRKQLGVDSGRPGRFCILREKWIYINIFSCFNLRCLFTDVHWTNWPVNDRF